MPSHCLTFLACSVVALTACRSTQVTPPRVLPKFPHALYFGNQISKPKLVSAHRGLPELPGFAENSTEGLLELAGRGEFIAEVDVAHSADSVLLLFHDDDLDRLTFHDGPLSSYTWASLDTMRLRDASGRLTESTIPSFAEALVATKGKLLYTIDRKAGVPYSAIAAEVERYGDPSLTALITYSESDYIEAETLAYPYALSVSPEQEGVASENSHAPVLTFLGIGQEALSANEHRLSSGGLTVLGTFGRIDSIAATDEGAIYNSLPVDVIATDTPLRAYRAIQRAVVEAGR